MVMQITGDAYATAAIKRKFIKVTLFPATRQVVDASPLVLLFQKETPHME
jgi:hypothetical protein